VCAEFIENYKQCLSEQAQRRALERDLRSQGYSEEVIVRKLSEQAFK
jgi:hypothetical protein